MVDMCSCFKYDLSIFPLSDAVPAHHNQRGLASQSWARYLDSAAGLLTVSLSLMGHHAGHTMTDCRCCCHRSYDLHCKLYYYASDLREAINQHWVSAVEKNSHGAR